MTSFETARGTVHARQCDHMGHANLKLRMQHDPKTRRPRAFPSAVAEKAKEIL